MPWGGGAVSQGLDEGSDQGGRKRGRADAGSKGEDLRSRALQRWVVAVGGDIQYGVGQRTSFMGNFIPAAQLSCTAQILFK